MLEAISTQLQGSLWVRPQGMDAGRRDQLSAAWFRLELELDAPVERARLCLSAVDRYQLFVNGSCALEGPMKGDHWNHYYETIDLAPLLRPGKNALVVRVYAFAHFHPDHRQYGPLSVYVSDCGLCFVAQGEAVLAGGGVLPLSTSEAAWTAVEDSSVSIDNAGAAYVGFTETRRLFQEPQGWRDAEPLGWPKAQAYFQTGINPYGEFSPVLLKARPIPNLRHTPGAFVGEVGQAGFPHFPDGLCRLSPGSSLRLILDAGVLRTAYLRLGLRGKGSRLRLTYAERFFPKDAGEPTGPMRRDDWVSGRIEGQFDLLLGGESGADFENFWFRTFRYVQVELCADEEAAELRLPEFVELGYPLDVSAQFDFHDQRLSQLWEISCRTLQRCMHETHEDCPYYEQLQYTLDTRLQMLFTYAVSGDTRMARSVLWHYHCSLLPDGILQSRYPCIRTQVIPCFALHWIYMLREYLIQTGDAELIRFYRPTVDAVLGYFDRHVNEQGLVEGLGYWDFGDWVEEWNARNGVPDAVWRGPSTVHNLSYAYALQAAAFLMEHSGRPGLAAEYLERAEGVQRAVWASCWDEACGLLREGPGFAQYSQHAQSLAVLTGLLTGEQAQNAMRAAMEAPDVLLCTFPWQFTLLRALEKVGLYGLSVSVFQQYLDMLDRHLTTIPEKPGETRSDCHAWSALPLYEFPRSLLGVRPLAIGWEKLLLRPQPLLTRELSGRVPTPKGEAFVHWRLEEGAMHLTADLPAVPVRVELPSGAVLETNGGHIELQDPPRA